MSTTNECIQILRARKAELESELAKVTKMLDAADGKMAHPTIVVVPPVPASLPVPFYPLIQPLQPYYTPPGMTGPFPGGPFGDTIICGQAPISMTNICIDSMPSIPVGLGSAVMVATGSH